MGKNLLLWEIFEFVGFVRILWDSPCMTVLWNLLNAFGWRFGACLIGFCHKTAAIQSLYSSSTSEVCKKRDVVSSIQTGDQKDCMSQYQTLQVWLCFFWLLTKILGRSSQFYEIQIRGWPRVVLHVVKTSVIRKWELISFWADVAVIVWGFCNLELEALRFSVAVDGDD